MISTFKLLVISISAVAIGGLFPAVTAYLPITGQADVYGTEIAKTRHCEPGDARCTIIEKDPNGPWPGGRVWIGVKKVHSASHGELTEQKVPILVDGSLGIDV